MAPANGTPLQSLSRFKIPLKARRPESFYGYLAQVLFKTPIFEIDVFDIADRLQIGMEGHILRDIRRAAREIEGLDFASGRIIECRIVKRGRTHILRAVRAVRERRLVLTSVADDRRRQEDQRLRDRRIEEKEYLRRFDELPELERAECQRQIDALLAVRIKNGLGADLHKRIATVEVMESYYTRKNDELVGEICAPQLMREEGTVAYNLDKTQAPTDQKGPEDPGVEPIPEAAKSQNTTPNQSS